jgi:hypothetical protein
MLPIPLDKFSKMFLNRSLKREMVVKMEEFGLYLYQEENNRVLFFNDHNNCI